MAALTASPLVLTKLRVPAVRPRVLPRTRLLNQLAGEHQAGLVLVCAPAGYGKTTLLTEWAQALLKNGTAVAWYALDSGDDDPSPFGSYLAASLIQALGPIPELTQIAQLLRASSGVDLQRILPVLINTLIASERNCVVMLDDYHLITHPVIHRALAYLLEHRPENLRVVIGSRMDPPLPLARLRARAQLLEIRSNHLRFNLDETAQFLNRVMQLEISAEGIAELETRTEGWAAGLQLASLALQTSQIEQRPLALSGEVMPPAFTGSHRYLVEYLMEEVVNRQPEEVQLFLLLTSVLERLCAPLCDALLNQPAGSAAILRHLEQANLFVVALDDQASSDAGSVSETGGTSLTGGSWYRYHHLFRDFLLAWLKRSQPERIPALHRAASEWLAANHFWREAAAQAFLTRDWEYAAAFVEQHGFTLIIHSEIATLHEWCSAFPEAVLQRHPALMILQCYGPAFRFQRQERERIAARLRQAEQLIARMEDRQMAQGLSESAAVVHTFLAMAPDPTINPRPQLELAQAMLGYYPEGEAGQFSALLFMGYAYLALLDGQAASAILEKARQVALRGHLYFGVVEASFHLARLAHSQGQLRRAAEICRQTQADIAALLVHPEQALPALGCLEIALGCVLLEQDQLEAAEQNLLHGLNLVGWGMNPYYLLTAYVALFRLREIQGRSAEALAYLEYLEAAWPDMAFCTGGLRALHALRTRPDDPVALAQAAAWSREFNAWRGDQALRLGMGPFGAGEAYYLAYLAWVNIQIAAGSHLPDVRTSLHEQLANVHGLATREIELTLLDAQLSQAEGDHQAAGAALQRALALAQPEGFIRSFDQGHALTWLLVEIDRPESLRGFIERVLSAIIRAEPPGAASPAPQTTELAEPLSERELEILSLMAGGATNQAIAGQLVITVGTVKSHINHILGKLDARNRTEAVARARVLGLLER